jgi:hypothetical protein
MVLYLFRNTNDHRTVVTRPLSAKFAEEVKERSTAGLLRRLLWRRGPGRGRVAV